MFYALSWFVVLGLLALWSLAAWALHAIVTWAVTNAGSVVVASGTVQGMGLPDWLAPWIPAEFSAALVAMASGIQPAIDTVLGWVPALAGGLTVAVWVVWALGSILLVVLGAVLSGMIALVRRRASAAPSATRGPAAAG